MACLQQCRVAIECSWRHPAGQSCLADSMHHCKPTSFCVQERSRALMPWLVPAPSMGIMGNSLIAKRLKKNILAAAQDLGRCSMLWGLLLGTSEAGQIRHAWVACKDKHDNLLGAVHRMHFLSRSGSSVPEPSMWLQWLDLRVQHISDFRSDSLLHLPASCNLSLWMPAGILCC